MSGVFQHTLFLKLGHPVAPPTAASSSYGEGRQCWRSAGHGEGTVRFPGAHLHHRPKRLRKVTSCLTS